MQIYLAAQYPRRVELAGYKAELEALGHQVTARWLLGHDAVPDDGIGPVEHMAAACIAAEDMADLAAAECVIIFTELPRSTASRGGRHVELGMALAWQKHLCLVGPRENVFCSLPQITHYMCWAECRTALLPQEVV